jgi:hypothetical protein
MPREVVEALKDKKKLSHDDHLISHRNEETTLAFPDQDDFSIYVK